MIFTVRYVDGVVFRKNVIRKDMKRIVERPRLLLLSGGIEFHRDEGRLSSFDTLLEQVNYIIIILTLWWLLMTTIG